MGCEQCKLSEVSESDSQERVIANIAADSVRVADRLSVATAPTSAEDVILEPPMIQCRLNPIPPREMHDLADAMATSNRSNPLEEPQRSLLSASNEVDSNILDSTERLEVNDEIGELDGVPSSCPQQPLSQQTPQYQPERADNTPGGETPGSSYDDISADNDNVRTAHPSDDQGDSVSSPASTNGVRAGKPLKKRATVRINSIKGHKVTRKLSINPGDTVISNQHKRDFVQLGGHPGCFHIAGPGCLWKQQAKEGEVEAKVLKELNESSLHSYVPDFMGAKEHDGKKWIGMEDLMCHFKDGCGMDIKMGTRTFKESEVRNQKLRTDLYEKMVNLDAKEPTDQENTDRAITKLRYMTFRERESSSQTLGFRLEAMKIWGSETNKDFKTLKHQDQVKNALKIYFNPLSKSGVEGFLRELENLYQLQTESTFFKEHEFVGTSLLFIYDHERVGIWMIDFGKTTPIRDMVEGGQISHTKPWKLGNYEDGYFFGMQNLITVVKEIYEERGDDDENAHQHTTLRVN